MSTAALSSCPMSIPTHWRWPSAVAGATGFNVHGRSDDEFVLATVRSLNLLACLRWLVTTQSIVEFRRSQ